MIPVGAWDASALPAHLRPTYRVTDGKREVARGEDLAALQASLAPAVSEAVAVASGFEERTGLRAWDLGDLPASVSADSAVGYPTLVDDGSSVSLRLRAVPTPAAHAAGVRRLLALALPSPSRSLADGLPVAERLALSRSGPLPALLADCQLAAVDALAATDLRSAAAFAAALTAVRAGLRAELPRVVRGAAAALAAAAELDGLLEAMPAGPAAADLRAQRAALVHPGFVATTGPPASATSSATCGPLRSGPSGRRGSPAATRCCRPRSTRWSRGCPVRACSGGEVEELRVSLFAPSVGARGKVSAPRLLRALDAL